MTKLTLPFLGLLILTSCLNQKNDVLTTIESEWIQIDNQSESLFDSADIGLVFRNDTVWSTSDRGWVNQGQYSLDKTKMVLASKSDTTDCTLQLFTRDSLTLSTHGGTHKYYNRRLEFNKDLRFRKITLNAGVCFGGCQSFDLELDSEGNAKLDRLEKGTVVNSQKYSMDLKTKETIDSLFKQSKIEVVDSAKFYGWFDDWTMKIKFEYGDNNVKEITGTHGYMPYRLKPIIGTLIFDLKRRGLIK